MTSNTIVNQNRDRSTPEAVLSRYEREFVDRQAFFASAWFPYLIRNHGFKPPYKSIDYIRHTSELSLIRAIPDLTIGTLKPSRQKGLFERLQREVDKDLARLPKLKKSDVDRITVIINEFGRQTNWLNQPRHIGTLLSFCLAIIENSKFKYSPSIVKTINDIVAHLENKNELKAPSCWAGSLAAEKWEALFKEGDHAK